LNALLWMARSTRDEKPGFVKLAAIAIWLK
jgi:hypothetical protein